MPFLHGTNAEIFVDGRDITTYLTDFSPAFNGEAVDVTTLAASWHDFIAGLKSFTFTANGFFDGAANAQDAIIFSILNTTSVWMWWPQGDTHGNAGYAFRGIETSYSPTSPIGGASTFTLSGTGKGQGDRVISLAAKAAITADTNGTNVDNGASSANGGAGYLQVFAYSGFTNVVFKIQHSVDNSVWVDLITFTTVTGAPTAEQVAVTGTVNRHTRVTADVTGSGSVTFAAGFGRR